MKLGYKMIETILIVFVMVAIPVGIVLGLVLSHYWKKQSGSFGGVSISLHSFVLRCAEWVSPRWRIFLENHHTILQYIEFGLIGALGTGVNALTYFSLRPTLGELAWILGIIIAFTFNFILDKYLVFNNE